MVCRRLQSHELPECLNVKSEHLGHEIVGREKAVTLWAELAKNKAFNAVVIECNPPISGHGIVGFGATVFVTREFAQQEMNRPEPYLNARLLDAVERGQSPVLTEAGIAACNRGDGLDLLLLRGGWLEDILNQEQAMEAATLLAAAFGTVHAGYRMRRILYEVVSDHQRKFLATSGVWRLLAEFKNTTRALFTMTREDAFAISGSLAAPVFQYTEPILQLRPQDQELLLAALDNSTDEELAVKLDLTIPGVKKRWTALFDRIAQNQRELLPNPGHSDGTARGKQKRHHLLTYVRAHPEELRPYQWEGSE